MKKKTNHVKRDAEDGSCSHHRRQALERHSDGDPDVDAGRRSADVVVENVGVEPFELLKRPSVDRRLTLDLQNFVDDVVLTDVVALVGVADVA